MDTAYEVWFMIDPARPALQTRIRVAANSALDAAAEAFHRIPNATAACITGIGRA